jgi:hypothetical protein
MKNLLPFLLIMSFSPTLYAWDFGVKTNLQVGSNSNVNLTPTNEINDTYKQLGGYAQIKNDDWRFKLKAKAEKYNKTSENDNYGGDLSASYKGLKDVNLTIGAFKLKYNGTTLINTDSTSDNTGERFEAVFNQKYSNESSGYFTLNGSFKNYSKIVGRKDKIFGGNYGIDYNISSKLLLNVEFMLQKISSTDTYYNDFSLGPYAMLSYTPNDNWEFFLDGSYGHTTYSGRIVTTITTKPFKSTKKDESQDLVSMDAGIGYNFTEVFSLQGKLENDKNNSNNTTSAYKANIVSLDFSARI